MYGGYVSVYGKLPWAVITIRFPCINFKSTVIETLSDLRKHGSEALDEYLTYVSKHFLLRGKDTYI